MQGNGAFGVSSSCIALSPQLCSRFSKESCPSWIPWTLDQRSCHFLWRW
ncbi:hypothetical protein QQP08_014369 [Theobroma cacao]|nr:hypothetical protein QQP08_014369 [Theobroma cacao]